MPTQTTDTVAPPVTPVTTPTTELTQDQKYANYRAGLIQQIKDAKSATPVAQVTTTPVTTPATTTPTPTPVQPDQNTMDGGKPVGTVPEATVVPTVPTPTNPVPEQPTPTPTTPAPISTTEPVQAQPQSFDEAFKILQAGGQLADTRNNSLFKSLYSDYNKYSNLDNKTLGSKIASGEVGPNFTNLLARFNPSKYAEAMKVANDATVVNDINTNASNLYSVASGTPITTEKSSDKMLQDLMDSVNNAPTSYKDIVAQAYADHPEIKAQGDKLAQLGDKIDQIDQNISTIYEQYRTKYPDVPEAMLMGMVNRATYGLTQERNALVREDKLLYAQYKEAKDQIDKGIEYDIAQQEKAEQRKFDLYGIVRGEEIRQEDFARADQKLADEIARADKKDKATLDRLEAERLDNVREAIAKLGVEPVGETYDELLGEYAKAIQNQPKEDKITTGLTPGEVIYRNGEFITVPGGEATTTIDFIKSKEGFRENAYLDAGGVPTIGYGFTSLNGKPVVMGQTISREEADQELQNQIDSKYSNWKNLVSISLSPRQEAALTSLEYNVGPGVWNFANGKKIIDAVNKGDFQTAADILGTSGIGTTVKSTGAVLPGLQRRRREEAQLLLDVGKTGLTSADVATFNNSTYKPQSENNPEMKKKYQEFLNTKNGIMSDKNASIEDILSYSQGGKDMTDADTKTITKFSQALDQLDNIQKQISSQDTGPLIGKLRNLNPYDTKAQVLQASLNALLPNLARGVYGEVGVLTDNDIAQYAKTIPTLTKTSDVNNAILAITLDTLAGGYKRQLQTLAAAGKDVSGFSGIYSNLKSQADSIKSALPGFNTGNEKKNIFKNGNVGGEASIDSNSIW